MEKICKVCNSLVEFGSNVNATTCKDCLRAGKKYCSQCLTVKDLSDFKKVGTDAAGNVRYSGECKKCAKKRSADYYLKNAERIKANTDKYHKENLAKYVEYSNRYAERNPEKRREQRKRAYARYAKTERGKMIIKLHNEVYSRSAKLGDLTAAQWQSILELFDFKCAYCGSKDKLSMEHLLPVSKGGALTKANIIVACQHCNSSRGNKDLQDWLQTIDAEHRDKIIWYINEGHKAIE